MPTKKTTKKRTSRAEDRSDAAAGGTGSGAIATAKADPKGRARSLDTERLDPQKRKTPMDKLLDRELVIYEVSVRKSDAKYADSEGAYVNEKGEQVFALLRFYFADDPKREEQFTTTGGVRIVPVIERMIAEKELAKGPVRATIVKDGRVYLFAQG